MKTQQKSGKIAAEFQLLKEKFSSLDRKVVIVFLSVAVLQTISWYFTSRRFFRVNLSEYFFDNPQVSLFEFFYWFIGDFFTLFILSVLIIKFFIRDNPLDYGLRFGDAKTGLKISFLFLGVMLPLIWFATSMDSFALNHPRLNSAKYSWNIFFIYQIGMFIYMFAWEFIWRGFMLFGLKDKFGYYAVFIQMIPFVILHNGKPEIETFGAIIGGLALGYLALRTKSFYYCVVTHFGVMFLMDFISVWRVRANDFGLGINSVFNLLKEIF